MKKNTLRKLTLSAVTMGVAALSLTSTTYAWFTTNGEATASGVKGTVAAADSNMLIKTPTNYSTTSSGEATWDTSFTSSASLVKAQNCSTNALTDVAMQPVTWSSTEFKKAGPTTGKFETSATMNVDVLHYEVVFAITNLPTTGTKKVTASFSDFAGDDASQYLLVSDGVKNAGETIDVNVLDALSVRIESTLITTNVYGITTDSSTLTDATKLNSTNANYRYKADTKENTCDAITYYNNVYGLPITDGAQAIVKPTENEGYDYSEDAKYLSKTTEKDGITLFTLTDVGATNTVYVKTDLYFYIDGWDYQCFNCLGGKGITAGNITFNLN